MGIAGIAMLAGVLVVLGLPTLPSGHMLILVGLPLAVLAFRWRRARILTFHFIGVGWCWWCAHSQRALRLVPQLEGHDLTASGWVASIPQRHPDYTSFELAVQQLDGRSPGHGIPKLIRLTWSEIVSVPAPGEYWGFHIHLKQPRGYMNPGSFDYEGWLFRHGIGATAYVIHDQAERLDDGLRFPLLRARNRLSAAIQQALPDNAFAGVAVALAVGDRSAIDAQQW
ncbi:MAG: ComEC/Rec2 family competence protein [Gammaproteobacteria bacterium]